MKTLQLTFVLANGKTSMVSLEHPRENITEEEVKAEMSKVIAAGLFVPKGEAIVGMKEARIVSRDVQSIFKSA